MGSRKKKDKEYWIKRARDAIDRDASVIYEVAVNLCPAQIIGNVKHLSFFVSEVAEWLEDNSNKKE